VNSTRLSGAKIYEVSRDRFMTVRRHWRVPATTIAVSHIEKDVRVGCSRTHSRLPIVAGDIQHLLCRGVDES
jgi:hypothetical protein